MRRLGRPPLARPMVSEIETLAASTTLSIREIQKKIAGKASRGVVGGISTRVRAVPSAALCPLFCSFQGTAFLLRIDPLKRLNCSLVQVQEIWIVAEALERFVERHGACAEVAERAPATAVRGVEQHDLVAVAGQA